MISYFTLSEVRFGNKIIIFLFTIACLVDWILFLRKGR